MDQTLKVLFVISEAEPLIKVGGLGDVGGTLPFALQKISDQHEAGTNLKIKVVIPYHDHIKRQDWPTEHVINYKVQTRDGFLDAWVSKAGNTDVSIYLIDGVPIRNSEIYSSDTQMDAEKYAFFSCAALELCRAIKWTPDILHAHDWHTAFSVKRLTQIRSFDRFFKTTKSLFTIHNLPYSGGNHPEVLNRYDLLPAFDPAIPETMQYLPMALGLDAADHVSTVSRTYAKEIKTDEFGHGYQLFFKKHEDSLSGILNGLLPDQWDPATDQTLYKNYSSANLSDRIHNKRMLQQELWLPQKDETPLFVMIGRMTYQKGFDLCIQGLRLMKDLDWQLIVLGTGEASIQNLCLALANEFPDRVRVALKYDGLLSKRLYAGGDMLLMPSRYEPCGIAQMISMLFGCIPVAHATGGLVDTIKDPLDHPDTYTGFLFQEASVDAAEAAMRRALLNFEEKESWRESQRRAMAQDFSWEKSAKEYIALYQNLGGR